VIDRPTDASEREHGDQEHQNHDRPHVQFRRSVLKSEKARDDYRTEDISRAGTSDTDILVVMDVPYAFA